MTGLTDNIKQFIREHENDNPHELALKSVSFSETDFKFILQQIAGRQIAKRKIPSWYSYEEIIYPKHLSLEQASSERTAIYKSSLTGDINTFIDLTGGLGVDFSFMSRSASKAVYVEKQSGLVDIAKHNFGVLGLHHTAEIQADAVEFLQKMTGKADVIYIDPARRDQANRKIFLIEDCVPNLIEIDSLLDEKSDITLIKLSPMLDITQALHSLKNVKQVHVVSVNNETKELILLKQKTNEETTIHCINLISDNRKESFVFTKNQEESSIVNYTDTLGKYLYEPNSSIMKAGAYKSIASAFSLHKLHVNSHLYTSNIFAEDFPGRKFQIKAISSFSKKDIKYFLNGITQANISVRNFPLSVDEIRKRIKLKEGGDTYIFATTLMNKKKVLILCEKINS